MEAHIKTDKPIYKPGDTMYIEVYLFDAFLKTPFTGQGQLLPQMYWMGRDYTDYPSSIYASI